MLKYLKRYQNPFNDQLNRSLLKAESDLPLVTYIEDAFKSLEIAPPIKILKFEYNDDESLIDVNKFIFKRDKKKKKKDKVAYKFIHDSRCGSLKTYIRITLPVKDPKTGIVTIHQKDIVKSILIPLQDERGYYYIKGKKYFLIYQICEKSSYTGAASITLKSLMPIRLNRETLDYTGKHVMTEAELSKDAFKVIDVNEDVADVSEGNVAVEDVVGVQYTLPVYMINMFKRELPVVLFYLANGVDWALQYLYVDKILSFEESDDDMREGEIWFSISNKCFLKVNDAELFNKYPYIQSVVGGILSVSSNRLTVGQLNDTTMWIKKLSNGGTNYAKGKDMLTFFNRLLDVTTQKVLGVEEFHKKDIYSLIRWMQMNFNMLRMKNNLDLNNKRIRRNEYIAHLLTQEFSRRLNRVISMGNKATIDNYKELFKFSGEILLQRMHASGINCNVPGKLF